MGRLLLCLLFIASAAARPVRRIQPPRNMDHDGFWQTVELARQACGGETGCMKQVFDRSLRSRDQFQEWYAGYYRLARRDGLWAACYIMGGGCSDDGFDYFRPWLVAQGKEIYLAALRDPDSLARVDFADCCRNEDLMALAFGANGGAYHPREVPEEADLPPDPVKREQWKDEYLRKTLPKLFARYSGKTYQEPPPWKKKPTGSR